MARPEVSEEDAPETRGRWQRIARWFGAALVIGCVAWTARSVDRAAVLAALASANLSLLLLASVASFVNQACKALYWGAMVGPVARVPFARIFRYTLVAAAASAVAPARAGDFARVWIFKRDHDISMRTTGAIVGFEKVSDVLSLLLLVAPLPWLLPNLPSQASSALRVLSVTPLLVIALVLAVRRSHKLRAWMRMPAGMDRAMLVALVPNALAWLADLGAIALVSSALGLDVSFATCALVLLGVNLAIVVPATPANVGTLELGAIAALGVAGVPTDRATAFALLYHVTLLAPVLLVGLVLGRGLLTRARPVLAPSPVPVPTPAPTRVDLVLRAPRTSDA